jgi:hypothetical protein
MLLVAVAASVFVTGAALSLLCDVVSAAEVVAALQMTTNNNEYKADARCADLMATL